MGMDSVGTYIRWLREQQGLTMAQVAEQAQVSPNYVWRIEAAQLKEPSFAHLASLLRAVGGSADDVLTILLDDLSPAAAIARAAHRLAGTPLLGPPDQRDDLTNLLLTIRKTVGYATHRPVATRAFLRALRALVSAWGMDVEEEPAYVPLASPGAETPP